jgi:hypothetical protein
MKSYRKELWFILHAVQYNYRKSKGKERGGQTGRRFLYFVNGKHALRQDE